MCIRDRLTTVKNLALSALDEEIAAEDVERILQTDSGGAAAPLPALFLDQPLRDCLLYTSRCV